MFLIGRVLVVFHLFLVFFKNSDFKMDSSSVVEISEVCREITCFLLVKSSSP